jgi:DNA invertase Pin-like site-specific DNA recombinase
MPETRFVCYCRSSTTVQQLGLEFQRQIVKEHVAASGGALIGWFEEVCSASPTAKGYEKHQPELAKAVALCRREAATLLVARLDRLTRSTALLSILLEEGPSLVVAETPHASRLMLQVYAALAEEHRQRISRRVAAGIAAAKAAGRKRNPHARALADRSRRAAQARAEALRSIIEHIRRGRRMAVDEVAAELNWRGLRSNNGNQWDYDATVLWLRLHRTWHSSRFPGRAAVPSVQRARALARAESLRPTIEQYQRAGARTSDEIAARLNAGGFRTPRGHLWQKGMTCRLLRLLAGESRQ